MLRVVFGGFLVFLTNLINAVISLLFWILVKSLFGPYILGKASVSICVASLAVSLSASGMNVAIINIGSRKGFYSLPSLLISSLIIALLSILIALALAFMVNMYVSCTVITCLITFFMVLSLLSLFFLISQQLFKRYLEVNILASLVKISMLIAYFLTNSRSIFSVLLCILAYYGVLVFIPTLSIFMKGISRKKILCIRTYHIKEILKTVYANYPYVVSMHSLIPLVIYIMRLLRGEYVDIGVFYLLINTTMLLISLPVSILNVSLSVKEECMRFEEILKIGLATITPFVIALMLYPSTLFYILRIPWTISNNISFKLLLLSSAPISLYHALIIKLNTEKKIKNIFLLGLLRIIVLILSLVVLIPVLGLIGSSLSILIANLISFVFSLIYFKDYVKNIYKVFVIHLLVFSLSFISFNVISISCIYKILIVFFSLLLLRIFSIIRYRELKKFIDTIIYNIKTMYRKSDLLNKPENTTGYNTLIEKDEIKE